MNLRILLISALISQAMMSAGGPIMRPADCAAIRRTVCLAEVTCCGSVPASPCADHQTPPCPRIPDDCHAVRCYVCLFLDPTPAIVPAPLQRHFTGLAGDVLAGVPSFPILTGAFAGTHGNIARPPPPSTTLRRAMLCCWTT